MLGWTAIRIAGDSMLPTTASGDWWLVRKTTRVRPGDLVALWHPERTSLLTVKRVHRNAAGRLWVLGDNPRASEDSRQFGEVPVDLVLGRLAVRYRRARAG